MKISRLLPVLVMGFAAAAAASQPAPKATFRFDPAGFKGDSTRLVLRVEVPAGWHIQAAAPLDSFLIPTTVKASHPQAVFGKPVFPKPVEEDFPALGGKVLLLKGTFDVRVPAKRKSPKVTIEELGDARVVLRYQACNNSQCLPPKEIVARYAGN
jgi:hypothetical protein